MIDVRHCSVYKWRSFYKSVGRTAQFAVC